MDPFADIRPYRDDEVPLVVRRLLADCTLVKAIEKHRFPGFPAFLQPLTSWLVRYSLRHNLGSVRSVDDVQNRMASFVRRVVKNSITDLTFAGFDTLPHNEACLFISNHRDIAMDPALLNFALHETGHGLVEIAIGDNLLDDPLIADIMRLNRSFVVPRSVEGHKARLLALTRLSDYIGHTLTHGRSIWIAQREGRAKDGLDRTDPALIKMLFIHWRKRGFSLSDAIRSLRIVPVAIAYEYDPCDLLKARELLASEGGGYVKQAGEDINSLLEGIAGQKGRVHIACGTPLTGSFADATAVAAAIDRQIHSTYRLFPSNILACERLLDEASPDALPLPVRVADLRQLMDHLRRDWERFEPGGMVRHATLFGQRLAGQSEKLRDLMLAMYANPVFSRLPANTAK